MCKEVIRFRYDTVFPIKKGRTVVAASGGFDPLHVGHVRYLKAAKALGDVLIVILNTDDWLIRKKGTPFMPFDERKEILEALECVDVVVKQFDHDDTVCLSLLGIYPDIFAKGGDRIPGTVPEEQICKDLGIKIVYGVGGDKIQSSSWLINGGK